MLYGELPQITLPNGTVAPGIRVNNPHPAKTAYLSLPTNEQMMERLDSQKSVRRNLGRRKSQTESVPNFKADRILFEAIRLDKDGAEFDEFESQNALSKLTYCEVVNCEREGEQYVITVRTPFGETKHWVSIPMQRDVQQYRRSVVDSMDLPHGMEELRFRIAPPVKLYDTVVVKTEGYAPSYKPTDVPPHHKSSVVVELVQALEEIDPVIDPNS